MFEERVVRGLSGPRKGGSDSGIEITT